MKLALIIILLITLSSSLPPPPANKTIISTYTPIHFDCQSKDPFPTLLFDPTPYINKESYLTLSLQRPPSSLHYDTLARLFTIKVALIGSKDVNILPFTSPTQLFSTYSSFPTPPPRLENASVFGKSFSEEYLDELYENQSSTIGFNQMKGPPSVMDLYVSLEQGWIEIEVSCNKDYGYMDMQLIPGMVNTRDLQMDVGGVKIDVGGFFQGTYKNYKDYKVFMIENVYDIPDLELTANYFDCIGTSRLLLLDQYGYDDFVINQTRNEQNFINLTNMTNNLLKLPFRINYNFLIFFAVSGINFQWNAPSQVLFSFTTRYSSLVPSVDRLPARPSYTFSWDESNLLINYTKTNNTGLIIKYEFFLAKSTIILSILGKCGIHCFETIENNGMLTKISFFHKKWVLWDTEEPVHNYSNDTSQNEGDNRLLQQAKGTNNSKSSKDEKNDFYLSQNVLNIKNETLQANLTIDERDYYYTQLKTSFFVNTTFGLTYIASSYSEVIEFKANPQTYFVPLADYAIVLIVIGVVVVVIILIWVVIKIYRAPANPSNFQDHPKSSGRKKKKPEDKQSLFPANNESVNINLKEERQNSTLTPNDINLSKIL